MHLDYSLYIIVNETERLMPWIIGILLAAGLTGLAGMLLTRRRRYPFPDPETLIIEPETPAAVQRTPDGAYQLRWAMPASARIYGGANADAINRSQPLAEVSSSREAVVSGINGRPYFEIEFVGGEIDGERIITAERLLPLAANFRDLGGYRTRDGRLVQWGRVYRSGALAELSSAEQAYVRDVLGIRLVCDLRSAEEVDERPDTLPAGVAYFNCPVETVDDDRTNRERLRALLFNQRLLGTMLPTFYTDIMIDQNPALFREVFERLCDPANLPTVIHCTAGKDRAGLTSALLLLALGVPEATVIADYSLSNQAYPHFREITAPLVKRLALLGVTVDDLKPLLSAHPDTMRATIDHIKTRYGSVEAYLHDAAGISDATIACLRANLLV